MRRILLAAATAYGQHATRAAHGPVLRVPRASAGIWPGRGYVPPRYLGGYLPPVGPRYYERRGDVGGAIAGALLGAAAAVIPQVLPAHASAAARCCAGPGRHGRNRAGECARRHTAVSGRGHRGFLFAKSDDEFVRQTAITVKRPTGAKHREGSNGQVQT